MTASEKYVAAAYLVVFVLVLAYVLIIAAKLQRLERAIQDLSVVRESGSDEPARETWTTTPERGHRGAIEAQTR